jgi:predicted DNA-binding transcriptional regulator YafY
MSKRSALLRYNLIIRQIRNNPLSFDKLIDYLELESDIQGYDFNISKRTFQRDLNDIRSIFNIDIQYNHSDRVYFINDENEPEMADRILEAFDIFNSLNVKQRLAEFVHFENREAKGTQNLYGLIHAIKNSVKISFIYKKFSDEMPSVRIISPYGIKEFKNRWYVVGKDESDNKIKTFALDRLSELSISQNKFSKPLNFDIHSLFQNNFGVITTEENKAEEIILCFTSFQANYIKSLPLHSSQKVLSDNQKECNISLNMVITHDFIMELLSLGDSVKVIKPKHLQQTVKSIYSNAINKY